MESIDELFITYSQDLLHYITSIIKDPLQAEDVLQETFYKAYIALDSYEGTNIRPWLFTIARHASMDYFRKQKRLVVTDEQFFSSIAEDFQLEERFFTNMALQEVFSYLAIFPKKQQKLFMLKVVHHFSYDECAEMMHMSVAACKSTIFRIRNELKKHVER